MIKNVYLLIAILVSLGNIELQAQACQNDTIFSDVIFLIDDSGSIDDAEFAAFSGIILTTINDLQANCPEASVGVMHYGGTNGQETFVEYPLSSGNVINAINRQYCTSRNASNICIGDGGDDLNHAIGAIITEMSAGGSFVHNTDNRLSLVILTDAFGFDTNCIQPNCSLILPTTNIDILKSTFDADVSVVGMSSQAEESLLGIYASPGGTYNGSLFPAHCAGSFDGCTLPRKYVEVDFNTDPDSVSAIIGDFVSCTIVVHEGLIAEAGLSQTVCGDLSQIATLTASASMGTKPYTYAWSNGAGTDSNVMVMPGVTTNYFVTVTDFNGCMAVDSVLVTVENCCLTFAVDAGLDTSVCATIGESTTLMASASGSGTGFMYTWNNGLGAGASHMVSPSVSTTYEVTASDNNGCMATDQVTVAATTCIPNCDADTTFSDVIFLIDNSGSIDDGEFATFENIILESLNGIRTSCSSSNRSVVHYGGVNGTSTVIEYSLGQVSQITNINRQFCTARDGGGLCIGGGGDDLNNAIGDIMTFLNNGSLNRNPENQLSLVIFTDAFGFDTSCGQPNCSLILPTTNIDQMKANYGVDVSVVGVSSQAEEVLLGIYASPGGTFNSTLYQPECAGSFDGCTLPRKYVQIEFNTPPQDVSDMITSFVDCTVEVSPKLIVEAGDEQTICANLGEVATLTALVDSGMGMPPYFYQWSDGLGTMQSVEVMPVTSQTYYVTATDANMCSAVDSVVVNGIECDQCTADSGTPRDLRDLCLENGQAFLPTESNIGIHLPMGFEEVFILTNQDLVILDYSVGFRNFIVSEEGLYRIHTLIAEVSNAASEDFLDLSIIVPNESELFLIANCIENHDICAAFDFAGRPFRVFGPNDMMCMTFENSINLCMDGIDNDGDGLVDCADEECKELVNCEESTLLACNDLTDNDGDGLVDCFDPDCFGFTVCFERGDNCNDGIDNDGDGLVDCADSSCDGSAPCEEDTPFTCIDGRDNDGDGLTDCQEPECQKFIVCAEYSVDACQDGKDNDFDGLVDCADIDCKELLGEDFCNPDESTIAKCSDGEDNDGDGLVDCADPDCRTNELLDVEANIDLLIQVTNATCPDNDNGSIRFIGIANNPNFQYSVDGGENYISTSLFTGLEVGQYDVAIKSEMGCALMVVVDVRGQSCIEICHNGIDDDFDGLVDCADDQCNGISDPYTPQIVNLLGADCPDFNNGTFSIAGVPGGVQYSIDGLNYQSLPKFSSLQEGTYNLSYKDQNGCYPGIQVVIPVSDKVCIPDEICNNGIDDDQDGLTDCLDFEDCPNMDSDGDGVCNSVDRCPGFDDALIGTACDDLNDCTSNDIYTTDCNCVGTLIDSDNDGICDRDDQCPDLDDTLIGSACDDGDACTINDTYTSDCGCVGVFSDIDNDGVCDADDQCSGLDDSLIGTPCDDGDACTINDMYTTDCNCVGIISDSDGDGICDSEDPCPTISGTFCPEICNNGLDDDADGLIDCEDIEDCQFNGLNIIDFKSTMADGKDAHVINKSTTSQSNFGTAPNLISEEGQETSGDPYHGHTFIEYPISQIFDENGIIIDSASIALFSDLESDQIGNNASLIHIVSEPWEELNITYNNRPAYNPDFFLTINRNNDFDKIVVDVKPLLDRVLEEDLPFYGFIIQPREKTPTRVMAFASSENLDQSRTPEIYVSYRANCLLDEICDNNIDDDGDGLIDCEDGDCSTSNASNFNINTTLPSCPQISEGVISIDGSSFTSEVEYRLNLTRTTQKLWTIEDSFVLSCMPDENYEIRNGLEIRAGDYRPSGCLDSCAEAITYLNFNWDDIPSNARIISASMIIYTDVTCNDSTCTSGPNNSVARRIISNWDENTLTYNNKPSVTVDNEIMLPSICAQGDSMIVDAKNLVEDAIANQGETFGIELSLLDPLCDKGYTLPSTRMGNPAVLLIEYSLEEVLVQTEPRFEDLVQGSYLLTIDQGNSCSIDTVINISVQECVEICNNGIDDNGDGRIDCSDPMCNNMVDFVGNFESTAATCPDLNDGIITYNGDLDLTGYTFSINGSDFQTTPIFTSLAPGEYEVLVSTPEDCVFGCEFEISAEECLFEICNNGIDDDGDGLADCADGDCVTVNTTTGIITDVVDASCPNFNNGSFTGSGFPFGGLLSIDGVNFQSDPSFENLSPGVYHLTFKDESGCYDVDTVVIDSSFALDLVQIETSTTSCPENNDGAIIIETEDATLEYSIDGVFFGSSPGFSNLSSGSYTLYIRQSSGCVSSTVVEIMGGVGCMPDDVCIDSDTLGNDAGQSVIDFSGDRIILVGTSLTDLNVGDVVLYQDAIKDCNDSIYDAVITIESIVGVTVEAEDSGINLIGANPSLNEYASFSIKAIKSGSATISNPQGTSASISNLILTQRDVDSNLSLDYTEVVGFANSGSTPDSSWLTNMTGLEEEGFIGEGSSVTGFDIFRMIPLSGPNNFGDNENVLIDSDDHSVHMFFNSFTEVELLFGVTGALVEDVGIRLTRVHGKKECERMANSDDPLDHCPPTDTCLIEDTFLYNSDFGGSDWVNGDSIFMSIRGAEDGSAEFISLVNFRSFEFTDTVIQSAELKLNILDQNTEGSILEDTISIQLINEDWMESTASYENGVGTYDNLHLDVLRGERGENIEIDVSYLLEEARNNDVVFYGFYITLKSPNPENYITFYSSEHSAMDKWPRLTINGAPTCENTTPDVGQVLQINSSVSLSLNVMLQGACTPDGGLMKTDLNDGGYLPGQEPETYFGLATPAGQPFNQAPWFYEGDEGKNMKSNSKSDEPVYDENVVDWVLVSLRMDASKPSEVWRGAGLLYNDGTISLFKPVTMDRFSKEGYYVVVEHRNHLPVMSNHKVEIIDGVMTYDFTSRDSFSSIIGIGQMQDEYGRYMMVAGNGELIVELSSDIDINARDLTLWLQNNGANSSYFLEDYDMNGDINIKDRILWEKNNGLFTTLQTK